MSKITIPILLISLFYGCSTKKAHENSLENIALILMRSCQNGSSVGCLNLSYMYEKGKGVLKDEKLAIKFKKKACSLGAIDACEKTNEKKDEF